MNRSKALGSEFAREVCEFIALTIQGVERRVDGGRNDRGDVAGLTDWVLECKRTAQIDLATAMAEAAREAYNAGARWWATIHKRRGKNVSESYVTMPLRVFVEVVDELRRVKLQRDRLVTIVNAQHIPVHVSDEEWDAGEAV